MEPQQLQAAGGVLYRAGDAGPEVLLIHRLGVWDLPKGKMEEGESREECARREVTEEVGLDRLPEITAYLLETRHAYREKNREKGRVGGTPVEKRTFWYAMEGEAFREFDFTPQRKEDILRVRWVPLDEAASLVGYENLREVLAGLRRLLDKGTL